MTQPEQCQYCGAEVECKWSTKILYSCQSVVNDDPLGTHQSYDCLEAERDKLKHLVSDIRNSLYVQTFDTCPPGYAGIINESMLRRLGVDLSGT